MMFFELVKLQKKFFKLIIIPNISYKNKLHLNEEVNGTEPPIVVSAGNTKGGSITVPLTSCLTGLESAV